MGSYIRDNRFVLEKEDAGYVWKFEAILEPIDSTPDVRTPSISYDLKSTPTIDVLPLNPGECQHLTTTHQALQPFSAPLFHSAAPASTTKEFNPAPLIFAGLMLAVTMFHLGGIWGYYQGSVNNQVQCNGSKSQK